MDKRLQQHPLGFWEVINKPTLLELQAYYAQKYYQEGKGSYEINYSEDEVVYFNAKIEQRHSVLQALIPNLPIKPKMIDVGCGEGYALSYFNKQGWSVKGIDFSEAGVASKNPHCLSLLSSGDVFSLLDAEVITNKTYDIVWLQNVLEHVIEPLSLLKTLRCLVKPDGYAVITVPNDFSITQQAAINKHHVEHEFWVLPPDHLTYFDYSSLLNTVKATGWDCKEALADFPVDWYLFHPGSNYVLDKAVGKDIHKARVQLENMIHAQPIQDVINYWSAAAKLGIGRSITIFLKPSEI